MNEDIEKWHWRMMGKTGGIIDADMCSSLGVTQQPLTRPNLFIQQWSIHPH